MRSSKILSRSNFKRSVWKNGLGFTDEIAIFPPEATLVKGDFLWRLSSARIEKASPFSVFPAHDRVLVILKGAGVRLTHTFEEGGEEETVDLPPFEAYEFPGDISSRCLLSDGPITDFSVFVRKAEVEPLVQIVEVSSDDEYSWSPEGRWNFAFAVQGSFEGEAGVFSEGDAWSIEYSDVTTVEVSPRSIQAKSPDSKLLLVSLL